LSLVNIVELKTRPQLLMSDHKSAYCGTHSESYADYHFYISSCLMLMKDTLLCIDNEELPTSYISRFDVAIAQEQNAR
jgi:hypothetical protein